MAEDLIPPPSPAGKPAPEGGPSKERETAPDQPRGEVGTEDFAMAVRPDGDAPPEAKEEPAEAAAAPGPSPYRSRFGLITGALAGMALAATIVLVLVVAGPSSDSEANRWSSWRPTSSDAVMAAGEIAQHVGRNYRLNDGSQLVMVESGPIAINDIPLTVVVRTAPVGGDIVPVEGNGVWYVLNGLGSHGSIEREEPSAKRLALLKREALELALYTFRYTDADHVVALLPPPPPPKEGAGASSTAAASPSPAPSPTPAPRTSVTVTPTATPAGTDAGEQPIAAMLFRPGDLRAQLRLPLRLTISPNTPRPRTLSDRDERSVNEFTSGNIFNASVRTAQNGAAFLVLDRAVPAPAATPAPTATGTPTPKKKKRKRG